MKLLGFNIKRAADPLDDKYYQGTTGLISNGTQSVTDANQDCIFAVYTCARVRSETLGMLPMDLFKRLPNNGREYENDKPASKLFTKASRYQSWQGFCETMSWHLDMRGNAYAQILRNKAGAPIELIILDPDRVTVKINELKEVYYSVRQEDGTDKPYRQKDVFHLKINSQNGIVGVSPLSRQRMILEAARAQENFLVNFLKNGISLSGILIHPGKFRDKNAQKRVLDSWRKAYGGSNAAGGAAILEEGMRWEKMSMTAVDAQFAELDLRSTQKVCAVMRIPGHKAGDLTHSKYANIETQNIDFVTDSLMPYAKRFQDEINDKLLDEADKGKYFAEFNFYELLKGDSKTRNEVLKIQREAGVISANRWCQIENMNPLGAPGDILIVPANFQRLDKIGEQQAAGNPASGGGAQDKPADKIEEKSGKEAFRDLFANQLDNLLTKQQNAIRTGVQKGDPAEFLKEFTPKHERLIAEKLANSAHCYLNFIAKKSFSSTEMKAIQSNLLADFAKNSAKIDPKERSSTEQMELAEAQAESLMCLLTDFVRKYEQN